MFRTIQTQSNGHRRLLSSRITNLKSISIHHNHQRSIHSINTIKNAIHQQSQSSISYYNQIINKRTITHLPSTTSPFKSLINRLQINSSRSLQTTVNNNKNQSILNLMHEWIPTIKHYQHTLPPLSQLYQHILFNTSKTPRGFGQFTKKSKSAKKTESASNESTPKSKPTESTSKPTETSTTKQAKTETKSTNTAKEGM